MRKAPGVHGLPVRESRKRVHCLIILIMYGQRLCIHDSFTLYWRTSSQSMHGAYSSRCSQPACPGVTYTVSLPYLVMYGQRLCMHDSFRTSSQSMHGAYGARCSLQPGSWIICTGSGALLTNQSSAMVSGDIAHSGTSPAGVL